MSMYVVEPGQGETADLGIATMRMLVPSGQTGGAFAMAEFHGGEGPWTVPHVHRRLEECFYVVDGGFEFTSGEEVREVKRGTSVLVPRGTPHVFRAGPGGGTVLVSWAPGGLEQMFLELARLPGESITDPAVRAHVSERFDSVPV